MAADVTALRRLASVLLWMGAYILASLVYYVLEGIASGAHSVPIVGGSLASWIRSAEAPIVNPLNDLRQRADAGIARGLSGLLDELAIFVGLAVLLGEGVKLALQYLWRQALRPLINTIVASVRTLAQRAVAEAAGAYDWATHEYEAAVGYADRLVARTLGSAEAFALSHALAAEHAAERYADQAVAALREAETEAIRRTAATAAAALAASETELAREIGAAEAQARALVAASETTFNRALGEVEGIAGRVGSDIEELVGTLGVAGAAGLIAAIPALATLVHAIATEAGLDRAECRSKVKGICGTDPSAWGELLAGLAALGLAFNLRELYNVARPLVAELEPIIAAAS